MSFSVSDTTEATIIGLGYNLYHFEAKTGGYNFDEDLLTQFLVYPGQNFKLPNQSLTIRLVNRVTVKRQQLRLPKSNWGVSRAFGKLRHNTTTSMFWPKAKSVRIRANRHGQIGWNANPVHRTLPMAVRGISVFSQATELRLSWNFIGNYKTSFPITFMF